VSSRESMTFLRLASGDSQLQCKQAIQFFSSGKQAISYFPQTEEELDTKLKVNLEGAQKGLAENMLH